MQGTVAEKVELEKAQRAMRAKEAAEGTVWEPLFFSQLAGKYDLFDRLAPATGWELHPGQTKGA